MYMGLFFYSMERLILQGISLLLGAHMPTFPCTVEYQVCMRV